MRLLFIKILVIINLFFCKVGNSDYPNLPHPIILPYFTLLYSKYNKQIK